MSKKIIIAGLLGGLVLIIWNVGINGLLGFNAQVNMKQINEERIVYEMLKEKIQEPGRYVCNPEFIPGGTFPEGEPVFSILYSGVGHEFAGKEMLLGLLLFFLAPLIAAWLLSQTSERILSSYRRKILFFFALGLLFAFFTDLTNFGIGNYPFSNAVIFALNHIIEWLLVGLVVAWQIKPGIKKS